MTWYQLVLACVTGVGFLNCAWFISWYGKRSGMKWFRSEFGRFLMFLAVSLGGLFAIACGNQIFGTGWWGRMPLSITFFAMLVGVTFWLPRILWASIRIAEKEAAASRRMEE